MTQIRKGVRQKVPKINKCMGKAGRDSYYLKLESSCFIFSLHHGKLANYITGYISASKSSLWYPDFSVFTIPHHVRVELVLNFLKNRKEVRFSLQDFPSFFEKKNEFLAIPCIQRNFSQLKSSWNKLVLLFIFRWRTKHHWRKKLHLGKKRYYLQYWLTIS